jgi:hypothetical protein
MGNKGMMNRMRDASAAMKGKYAHFFWPVLRAIALIVALCAFIPFLSGFFLDGGGYVTALSVFMLATFALIWMSILDMSPATQGEGTARLFQLPWALASYVAIIGLGFNWICVFLWFSKRCAFFSLQVIGVTGLIMAFYVAIALLVVRLTGGNWRIALATFGFALVVPAVIALRLGLLW